MKTLNFSYVFFISSNALVMAYMGAMAGLEHLSPAMVWTNRFIGIYGVWSNSMVALVITLARRESEGKPLVPINGGNTEVPAKKDLPASTDAPKPAA